ncbi:MAG: glycosyl hydrolase family 43 [Chitinophagaceae bacterium]|nr:MAG: glycosyl hydrolase family 43 [Chitinophagaceae bacterium]
MKRITALFLLLLAVTAEIAAQTFSNPLLPAGADPWALYKDGYYYYTNTTGKNITIWKTKNLAELKTAKKKVVFDPPATGPYSKEIWAPEIHFLRGKWYIYFAADSGNNKDHRLWVLENSGDPMKGKWIMKGKLATPDDKWSIDGTVYEHHDSLYLLWSGWKGDVNGEQDIFIARMSNPWTVTGERVMLSSPKLSWETHGDLTDPNDVPHVNVNEGPQILAKGNKLHLIYSASGCWTDFYALGMMTATDGSNLMDTASWVKNPEPVFKQDPKNGVYAPGHNSFFTSPDGKEDWILYHANDQPGQGCGRFRSPRAQKFTWTSDNVPVFGTPVKTSEKIAIPSGK